MVVNWTNHLDEVITNHNSETLEFEQVIIKTLVSEINYAIDVNGNIVQDIMLSSEAEISNSAEALVGRERSDSSSVLLDVGIESLISRNKTLNANLHYLSGLSKWTNHNAVILTNHLGEELYFFSPMLKPEQTRFRRLNSSVEGERSIAATQSREMSSSVNNDISIELTALQVRERMLDAVNAIQTSLQSTIKKFVGYFQTIMAKIKE